MVILAKPDLFSYSALRRCALRNHIFHFLVFSLAFFASCSSAPKRSFVTVTSAELPTIVTVTGTVASASDSLVIIHLDRGSCKGSGNSPCVTPRTRDLDVRLMYALQDAEQARTLKRKYPYLFRTGTRVQTDAYIGIVVTDPIEHFVRTLQSMADANDRAETIGYYFPGEPG